MVNVVITVPVIGPEMPVNDKRVCIIVNIRIIAANIVPVYIRHGAYDPPDLIHADIWVRLSEPLFVAGEIILEHPDNHSQSVRPWFITPFYQFPKCLKIKKRIPTPLPVKKHLFFCLHLAATGVDFAVGPFYNGASAQKRRRHFIHLFLRLHLLLHLLLLL